MTDNLILKMNILGGMDSYIREVIGDDNITNRWFVNGLPDGCDEDTLREIAEDEESFINVCNYWNCLIRCDWGNREMQALTENSSPCDETDEDPIIYYKIECNNGYLVCNETFYVALPKNEDIYEYAQDVLENLYSYYEPDISEEEYDNYMQDSFVEWEKISKEEFEKSK